MCLDNTAMAIFKFDCFIPYCCFLGFWVWYGYGYCLFTDWHWRIRELLGYPNDSNSYIYFLILKLTGIHFPEKWIDLTTAIVFYILFH
jgi:hypothetical protein